MSENTASSPSLLNTGLPSIRKLQTLIKDKQTVEIKLLTNDILEGKLQWQDNDCICIGDSPQESILVWRQAIVYLKASNGLAREE